MLMHVTSTSGFAAVHCDAKAMIRGQCVVFGKERVLHSKSYCKLCRSRASCWEACVEGMHATATSSSPPSVSDALVQVLQALLDTRVDYLPLTFLTRAFRCGRSLL